MRKTEQDIIDALGQLALWVKSEVDRERSEETIQPEEEIYYRERVDVFQYTESCKNLP